ncbi:hypothetical protein [Pyxidicoccus trucidator]|uniref:hypothetical protein n=1 Tax=Pyxidicoccus trucidator TaxID=2709662 RepID=UPI001967A1F3|nr:hypothetical protein [Pyxidicoccus trucidator]
MDERLPEEGAEALTSSQAEAEVLLGLADACQQDNYNQCVAAGYGACSAWSATSDCGPTSCDPEYGLSPCYVRDCTEGPCQNIPLGATFQSTQKYRVCSNPLGQTCTEWLVLADFRRVKCGC